MCFLSSEFLTCVKRLFVLKMMDMFFFMFLLSIWVVAYGVAKQGILIDNDNRLDWIVRGAIYEPYLIIFGDFPTNIDSEWRWRKTFVVVVHRLNCLFLYFKYVCIDDITAKKIMSSPSAEAAFDIDSCTLNGTDPLKPKCPMLNENQTPAFPEWLTIVMLCVYLLFANILLLNLLIAIFKWAPPPRCCVFIFHPFCL